MATQGHQQPRCWPTTQWVVNSLRPRPNRRHFTDDIFKRMFFNENVWISIKILLKFVAKGPINNIPTLVQIMTWRRSGDKPLSEPMMVSLPTHLCVTRPQWVLTCGHVTEVVGSNGFMVQSRGNPDITQPGLTSTSVVSISRSPYHQYRKSYCRRKTVLWPSFFQHGTLHTKMTNNGLEWMSPVQQNQWYQSKHHDVINTKISTLKERRSYDRHSPTVGIPTWWWHRLGLGHAAAYLSCVVGPVWGVYLEEGGGKLTSSKPQLPSWPSTP